MTDTPKNLFAHLPDTLPEEWFQALLSGNRFTLERIVSLGHATPAGQWYDQARHEWVVLLSGSAGVYFEGDESVQTLHPGDYVHIPAHRRHRVEWTDPKEKTVWLALHYETDAG
ncbi:cupin domain-containing protein [Methylohalobius crimeensis]|uniref:cupin domain-containing protein n=1 Tax=Methylohalobius crimeensis TaxID=244365 RepID=UPI0003B31EFF|nr:cupin domain-containing protein [Methylohalobius crimeensis]